MGLDQAEKRTSNYQALLLHLLGLRGDCMGLEMDQADKITIYYQALLDFCTWVVRGIDCMGYLFDQAEKRTSNGEHSLAEFAC
jgi:hypothetical protein